MPYGFALHTTSTTLGLATIDCSLASPAPNAPNAPNAAEPAPRVRTDDLGRGMLAHLHPRALEFVAPQRWADCAFIAVAKGPGSFTSTRIGVTAARTFGQQLQVPVYGISTLEAAAFAELFERAPESRDIPCAVSLAAAREEVFTGIYGWDADRADTVCLQADAAVTPAVWADTLAQHAAIASLEVTPDRVADSTAALARMAYRRYQRSDRPHWSQALPFYGQHPIQ